MSVTTVAYVRVSVIERFCHVSVASGAPGAARVQFAAQSVKLPGLGPGVMPGGRLDEEEAVDEAVLFDPVGCTTTVERMVLVLRNVVVESVSVFDVVVDSAGASSVEAAIDGALPDCAEASVVDDELVLLEDGSDCAKTVELKQKHNKADVLKICAILKDAIAVSD